MCVCGGGIILYYMTQFHLSGYVAQNPFFEGQFGEGMVTDLRVLRDNQLG